MATTEPPAKTANVTGAGWIWEIVTNQMIGKQITATKTRLNQELSVSK